MTTKYLDLKLDFMFKQVFGNPRRKSITIAFLNDLLRRKDDDLITDVHYENTEMVKEEYDGKTSRLDVLVSTKNGEKINIEIQLRNHPGLPERILYYWSKLYASTIGSGDDYAKLVPTIMISILDFPLFPQETDSIHNVFKLLEENEHFIWSQHLEFHVFNLSQFMVRWKKYRREMKQSPSTEYPWLMMLSAANYKDKTINQEMIQELEEFAMKEQEVREALIEWEMLSSNKENKALYEARLKFLRDELAWVRSEKKKARDEGLAEGLAEGIAEGLKEGLKEGLEEGIEIGRIEGKVEGKAEGRAEGKAEGKAEGRAETYELLVKNLKNDGMTVSKIAQVTGLKEEEVSKYLDDK